MYYIYSVDNRSIFNILQHRLGSDESADRPGAAKQHRRRRQQQLLSSLVAESLKLSPSASRRWQSFHMAICCRRRQGMSDEWGNNDEKGGGDKFGGGHGGVHGGDQSHSIGGQSSRFSYSH